MRSISGFLMLLLLSPAAYAAEVEGELDWSQRVELGTSVSGIVKTVHVNAGEDVKKGAVMLELDQRALLARFEQAAALEKSMQLKKEEADKEWERAQELYERTVLSDHELALARIKQAEVEAQYTSAKAERAQAQMNKDYSVVKAPFDGVVVKRMAEPGQIVSQELAAQPMLVFANNRAMLVRVFLNSADTGKLRQGQAVDVSIRKQLFRAKVRTIGMERVQNGYPVEFVFDAGENRFRKGMKAEVRMP